MGELGACPGCGAKADVIARNRAEYEYETGNPIWQNDDICCLNCGEVRPDLICRDGRIEKREASDG